MKLFWISFILFLPLSKSFAQKVENVTFSGKVQSINGNPLEGAYVALEQNYVWTDKDGDFSTSIKAGTYQLKVSMVGYRDVDTLIMLGADTYLDFFLKQKVNSLEEVLLEGHEHRESTQSVVAVDQEYIEQEFRGSLATSLEKLPGFNAMQIGAGASKPIIRGLGLNRVAVSENGIKQEGQQWGADHGLEIDALQVEDLEIVKGVGTIAYGSDVLGGVVKINNKSIPKEGISGSIYGFGQSVNNSMGTSAKIAYRKKEWFAKAKFSGISYGDYNLPTQQISYLNYTIPVYNEQLKNSAGKEVDWFGQLGVIKNKFTSIFSVSQVYQKSGFFPGAHGIPDIGRVEPDGNTRNIEEPFQRVSHFKVINNTSYYIDNGSIDIDFSYQDNHRQEWSLFHTHYGSQEPPETNPNLELDFKLQTYSLKGTFHKRISREHDTKLGLDLQWKNNDIAGFNFLLPEYKSQNYGLFVIHEYQPSSENLWELGLRFDYGSIEMEGFYDSNLYEYLINSGELVDTAVQYAQRSSDLYRNFTSYNIRMGYNHIFNKSWRTSFNLGTAFRLPTAIELGANGIHHGSFRHEQGEPNLNPEKGLMGDANLQFSEESWEINFSPYVYYFSNYIFLKPTGSFSLLPHSGQLYQYTESEALLSGIELQVEKKIGELFRASLAGEFLYNQQLTSDSSRNYPLPFSPANNLYAEAGYRVLRKSDFITSSEISVNNRLVMEQERIAQGEDITPGYQLWGLAWRADFHLGGISAHVNFRIDNLLNTRYFNHTSFYRRLQIPEMGRNFQLSVKVPFGN